MRGVKRKEFKAERCLSKFVKGWESETMRGLGDSRAGRLSGVGEVFWFILLCCTSRAVDILQICDLGLELSG